MSRTNGKLTGQLIAAAKEDAWTATKPIVLWDKELRGFGVRIGVPNDKYTTGKVSFFVQRRTGGRGSREIRCVFDAEDVSEARDKAITLIAQIRSGSDPNKEKKDLFVQRRTEYLSYKTNKFNIIAENYRLKRINENQRGNTNYFDKEMPQLFKKYVYGQIGNRAFIEITRDDIKMLLKEIPTLPMRGKVEAMLRPLFKYAVQEEIIKLNVFDGIAPTAKPAARERVLNKTELKAFWLATSEIIASPKPLFGYCYRVILLTGARLREISDLEWNELDLDTKQIEISSQRTKNKLPHIIPLNELAIGTLKAILKKNDKYVFSYGKHPINGHSVAKKLLDKKMQFRLGDELEPFVIHDTRRVFATTLASIGIEPHVIEKCLGHSEPNKLHAVYNKFQYLVKRREALQKWGEYLAKICKD